MMLPTTLLRRKAVSGAAIASSFANKTRVSPVFAIGARAYNHSDASSKSQHQSSSSELTSHAPQPSNSATIVIPYDTPSPAVFKEGYPNLPQSPNHASTWSTSQNPRGHAMSGPRFEQTDMELQAQPLAAIDLVKQDPVRLVEGRRAACDGGGGPLGHPKVYINLDKPGPKACGYCGIRFEKAHHHH